MFLVPSPIAGDPRDVVALEAMFRRDFLDRFGNLGRDHDARFGVVGDGSRKGFMHWPAGQHFHVLRISGILRLGLRRSQEGDSQCDGGDAT